MNFYVYHLNFHLNLKGFVNIHKAKNQMTNIVVHDGKLLPKQQSDAILSMLELLVAEIKFIL